MKLARRHHKRMSRSFMGLLISTAIVGLITLFREEPAIRRYLRIARM